MKVARCTQPQTSTLLGWSFVLALPLALFGAGCHLVQRVADVPGQAVRAVTPGQADKNAVDPVEVQQAVLRLADEFSTRMTADVEKLRRGTNAPNPAEILQLKITLVTDVCSIASGPNALASLLDLTVLVSLARAAVEEHWQPKVFGESARPALESCRVAETNLWQFAGKVFPAAQQAELRQAIDVWRRQNPPPEVILSTRAFGIATQVARANRADTTKPGSVFSLLGVDPLSGLDPAMREIAQTRLLAERALYVTQKMPTLLRWQMELLSVNAVSMPEVRQMVTNSTEIAASVDRLAHVAEQLPAQLSSEREAILKSLESQESKLTPLVNELGQTLLAGSQMSTSLNTTIATFDALMKRFGVGETNLARPRATNAEPFRIEDYGQTAVQLEAAARQLTELLQALNQTFDPTNLSRLSAQVRPVVQQAQTGGQEIVDYAFWKGVLLLAVMLAAAMLYRFLVVQMTARKSSSDSP